MMLLLIFFLWTLFIDAQQGVKRTHEDSYSSQDSRDEDSYNRHDRGRYNDYERDSKRAAYDSGTSRPECNFIYIYLYLLTVNVNS